MAFILHSIPFFSIRITILEYTRYIAWFTKSEANYIRIYSEYTRHIAWFTKSEARVYKDALPFVTTGCYTEEKAQMVSASSGMSLGMSYGDLRTGPFGQSSLQQSLKGHATEQEENQPHT